jgi:adenine deaminase
MSKGYVHTRCQLSAVTKDLAAVAMGQKPADLIFLNGSLVNVNVGYVQKNIDVVVKHGFIAFVGKADHVQRDAKTKVVDCAGKFLVPGLIDSHMHIESSMVDPRSFVAGILPHGVTTICPDNHEITNVLGLRAVELFHKVAEGLPVKMLIAMPVCVPSFPGFEDAGAEITAADVTTAYNKGWAQLQGEQMNFPGVLYGDDRVHAITAATLNANKVLTGHYPSLELEKGLNAFAACGLAGCHEVITAEGVTRRVELGVYAQIRQGTAWLHVPPCVKAYTENPGIDTRYFALVTDDVTSATVFEDGQLLRVVRTAIKNGVPPIKAIQFATINAAQLLDKSRWIGSISPSRCADILVVSDLAELIIEEVYCDGVLVGKNGKLTVKIDPYAYPEWALKSVYLKPLSEEDFLIPAPKDGQHTIRAIGLFAGECHTVVKQVAVTAVKRQFVADVAKDLAKAFIFYRHEPKKEVTDLKGYGFITGLKFKENCAYASTVSHDCHNLLVVGTSDTAMKIAANKVIEGGGGLAVVVANTVEAAFTLPLAGLMSLESCEVAAKRVKEIEIALKKTGCQHESVEMTMSLIALVCIPEIHMSNRGLVLLKDGAPPRLVSLVVGKE